MKNSFSAPKIVVCDSGLFVSNIHDGHKQDHLHVDTLKGYDCNLSDHCHIQWLRFVQWLHLCVISLWNCECVEFCFIGI